jgi:hypothetical protein
LCRHSLVEILRIREDISYDDLSKRLGSLAERSFAAYVVGKDQLREDDLDAIGKALGADGPALAQLWAEAVELEISKQSGVKEILNKACRDCKVIANLRGPHQRHSRATVIRGKFADRLPPKFPSLRTMQKAVPSITAKQWEFHASGYPILVEAVHHQRSYREIASERGVSEGHVRNLAEVAAIVWARHEGIDLVYERSLLPFKNEVRDVTKLYEALRLAFRRIKRQEKAKRGRTVTVKETPQFKSSPKRATG